jgi:5-formaminoimidazole-4-carboxamide-1-beta-D-ribofuranosyl 5'-monophosphate synthetase
MAKVNIYLDDVRTPVQETDWIIVRDYNEFVTKVEEIGLENIDTISLDHDLDKSAMVEWLYGAVRNYAIDYSKIKEKTGFHCAKWLIEKWKTGAPVVKVTTHSANAIGSANIMGYINNYKHVAGLEQDCIRVQIEHTIEKKEPTD